MNENMQEEMRSSSASDILKERKRNTAFKLRISDINRGHFITKERASFLELDGKEISKVNIIANIIDKFISEGEKRYAALTIDDASSQIRLKLFGGDTEKFKEFEIGDTMVVIGTLRIFNNEVYILPEIMKKLSSEWLLVRKLEIEKLHSLSVQNKMFPNSVKAVPAGSRIKPVAAEQKNLVQSVAFNNPASFPAVVQEIKIKDDSEKARDKILEILRTEHEGADVEKLILSLHMPVEEINKAITEMLEQAEIYEPKPGKIRLL